MNKNELGLFIVRVVVGLTFFFHGLDKFQSGIANIAGWFESIGLPGFLAYIVAIIELVGGLAMVLGIGTKVIGALFAIIMVGAILTTKWPEGFLGGFELDVILLAASIQLIISSSQSFSIGAYFNKPKHETVQHN
ncbi:DoxX family protein [Halalkalibacter krulwichiae]|uniref:Putative oxidoreductase CatD n=1 Tax=Halalkalibacter krulwichiae TaxID=199441 RepID=A0A1X9M9S0_9BACI|nr:DoxX family protein [Halalkalibacter krulwichiae]ARK30209.1 Putative oxidoreductase CatD [Halalkalibacter krulwichiae]